MQEAQEWQNKYDALKADHDTLLAQRIGKAQGSPKQGAAPDANGDAGMPSAHHGHQTRHNTDGDGARSARERKGSSTSLQHIAELQVCRTDTSTLGQHSIGCTIIAKCRIPASSVAILSADVYAQAELEQLRSANNAVEVSC